MDNEIEQLRASMEQAFDPTRIIPRDRISDLSPCGRYQLDVDFDEGSNIALAVVRSAQTGQVIASLKRNHTRWFHGWIVGDEGHFLVCSEDLEGQTVVDLLRGVIAGFSPKEGSFIWTEFHPSPNKKLLAIGGCFWACPWEVIVYDFSSPMSLPLPVAAEFLSKGGNHFFVRWVDDTRIVLRGSDGIETIHDAVSSSP